MQRSIRHVPPELSVTGRDHIHDDHDDLRLRTTRPRDDPEEGEERRGGGGGEDAAAVSQDSL